MSVLFPKIPALLHGGDYNPDQWLDRPDILEEDIKMMKKAGVNTATVGVFSWSTLEPQEGNFQFGWLHDIMKPSKLEVSFLRLKCRPGKYTDCCRVYSCLFHHFNILLKDIRTIQPLVWIIVASVQESWDFWK